MTVEHHKGDETLIARSMRSVVDVVKTPPSPTTWLVIVAVLLIGVLIGAWFTFTASATASSSALWVKLDQTPSASDDLVKFANHANNEHTVQARFALAKAARLDMQNVAYLGSNTDRNAALKQIEEARTTYQKLVDESGDTPVLMQECLMGAAKTNEILNDLNKAKQYYQRLAHDYPNGVFGKEAADRIKALNDEGKQTIEALANQFATPN